MRRVLIKAFYFVVFVAWMMCAEVKGGTTGLIVAIALLFAWMVDE